MKKPIPTSPASLVTPDQLLPEKSPDLDEAIGSLSRDPSDPPVDRGEQKPTFEGDDENEDSERLVERGVEEAADDQAEAGETRHF
jgi:hypothetical protein